MIYAVIDENGFVINTIQAEQEFENRLIEIFGKDSLILFDEEKDEKKGGVGFYYDKKNKYFTPYKSWILDVDGKIKTKKQMPNDKKKYIWDEKTENWKQVIDDEFLQKPSIKI